MHESIQSTVATFTSDPYYGLTTTPPGKWRIVDYGRQKAVILQGSLSFIDRNLNMLSSYGGGRVEGEPNSRNLEIVHRTLWNGAELVPITEARMIRALSLYFYVNMYRERNGDTVDTDVLDRESRTLALAFYEDEMKGELGFTWDSEYGTTLGDGGWSEYSVDYSHQDRQNQHESA